MGKFVMTSTPNGEYHFNLKAANGQVILSSENYANKANCENGIASVKRNAADEANFEKLTASNGKPYFNLKATNGQIIGQSERYESTASRDNGIASVMTNAPDAAIETQT